MTLCEKCLHAEVCAIRDGQDEGDEIAMTYCSDFQGWISVEDRLPEESGYYLIHQKLDLWFGEIIQTARWIKTERIFRGAQAGCFMEYVTHWMPLPEAPKMKGGEE